MAPDPRSYLLARARLVGRGLLVGGVLGAIAVVVLYAYSGSVAFANQKAFAIGALLLGLALLGWSGSIMAGRGIENLQHHLDTNTRWTEADSRRAMALVGGTGFGWMVGVAIASWVARAIV
jgi:hypothetical protein